MKKINLILICACLAIILVACDINVNYLQPKAQNINVSANNSEQADKAVAKINDKKIDNYITLLPQNFIVKKGADLISSDGTTVDPEEGDYSLGEIGQYLFKGSVTKPAENCNITKFLYSFQNFENKDLQVTFKRSPYGGFDIALINEQKQFVDFDSDSNDVPINIVRACQKYDKCEIECNAYAGGWIESEYDWGQATNDNAWHTLKISKESDKFIFNLDNGYKIKEVKSVYGCNKSGEVKEMDFSKQVNLLISGWSCKWKSDTLNYEIKEVKIRK